MRRPTNRRRRRDLRRCAAWLSFDQFGRVVAAPTKKAGALGSCPSCAEARGYKCHRASGRAYCPLDFCRSLDWSGVGFSGFGPAFDAAVAAAPSFALKYSVPDPIDMSSMVVSSVRRFEFAPFLVAAFSSGVIAAHLAFAASRSAFSLACSPGVRTKD